MIERDRERPEHFGKTALCQAPKQLHLRKPKMGMDQTQGDRKIVVGLRLDEGYQVPVLANLDRAIERSPLSGYRSEPLLARLPSRPVTKARHAQPDREAARAISDLGH